MAKLKLSEELRKAEAAAEAAAFDLEQKRMKEKLRLRESREMRKEQKRRHNIEDSNYATTSQDLHENTPQPRPVGRERSLSGGVRLMRMFHAGSSESSGDASSRRRNRKSLSDGVQLMSQKPEPLSEIVVSSKCCISVLNVHSFLTQLHL